MKNSFALAVFLLSSTLLISYPSHAESKVSPLATEAGEALSFELGEILDSLEIGTDAADESSEKDNTDACVSECNRRHKNDLRLCRVDFQLASTACQRIHRTCFDRCPLIDLYDNCRNSCQQDNLNCLSIAGGALMNCGRSAQKALGDCLVNECGFHRVPVDFN